MRPVTRFPANKFTHARRFRKQMRRTKIVNMKPAPMRGGFRI